MKIAIRLSVKEERKALPIILRRSPGMIFRDRTYVLSEDTVESLKEARIKFTELCRDQDIMPNPEGLSGERI